MSFGILFGFLNQKNILCGKVPTKCKVPHFPSYSNHFYPIHWTNGLGALRAAKNSARGDTVG